MNEVEAELSALARAAKQHPGRMVESYSPADREALARLAMEHRRLAERYETAAGVVEP